MRTTDQRIDWLLAVLKKIGGKPVCGDMEPVATFEEARLLAKNTVLEDWERACLDQREQWDDQERRRLAFRRDRPARWRRFAGQIARRAAGVFLLAPFAAVLCSLAFRDVLPVFGLWDRPIDRLLLSVLLGTIVLVMALSGIKLTEGHVTIRVWPWSHND